MKDYGIFFQRTFGFKPYDYQKKVAEYLLSGRNIIVCVYTGGGKSLAATAPFLFAREIRKSDFPQKMIFSLPQRTLANSLYGEWNRSAYFPLEKLSIQTGEFSDDPYFEKDMIIATIDQTLSGFLGFPLALSKREANINTGAFVGSYLIFDEFHLLDTKLAMTTTLGIIRALKNSCRVCIMTATLSDKYIHFLKERFDFEVVFIKDFPEDMERMGNNLGLVDARKKITLCPKKIDADEVLNAHCNRTIVICNRVETAQILFSELERMAMPLGIKVICLHARFFDKDRKEGEKLIWEYFGKDAKKMNAILVATQVVEVGMNISCDVMHTEISPANSFLQRLGRLARFTGESGVIYLYGVLELTEKEKIGLVPQSEEERLEIRQLNNHYLPYDRELCEATWKYIEEHDYRDIIEHMVDKVLAKEEEKSIQIVSGTNFNWNLIKNSWCEHSKGFYRKTIRDIQSLEIVLYPLQEYDGKKLRAYRYETISVYKWSFISWVKKVMADKINLADWVIAKVTDENAEMENLQRLEAIKWDELKIYEGVVFVDARYLTYSSAGLCFDRPETVRFSSEKEGLKKGRDVFSYHKESYRQHVNSMLIYYETVFRLRLNFVFQCLDKLWGKYDWDRLIKIVFCFHDYGKLNIPNQKIMTEYQLQKSLKDSGVLYIPGELLAHTDYDPRIDEELARMCGMKNRPPHAGVGGYALYEFLKDKNEKIALVAAKAVLHHHSPNAEKSCEFDAGEDGKGEMEILLREIGIKKKGIVRKGKNDMMNDVLVNKREWLLYFVLVRLLRLCDRQAIVNSKNNEHDKI